MAPILYTADEVLVQGLKIAGFDTNRQQTIQRKTNISRFKAYFGAAPLVYTEIWEALQVTRCDSARIDTAKAAVNLETFLSALYFIHRYPTEIERSGHSGKAIGMNVTGAGSSWKRARHGEAKR
jgi:hypothetical protein